MIKGSFMGRDRSSRREVLSVLLLSILKIMYLYILLFISLLSILLPIYFPILRVNV